MAIERTARLPFWRTVAQAYVLTFRNLGYLARISWAWLALTIPVAFAYHALAFRLDWHKPAWTWGSAVDVIVSMLLYMPLLASIAVAWHRRLLVNETRSDRAYLRLDRPVIAYLGLAALISVLATVPFFGTAATVYMMNDSIEQGGDARFWFLFVLGIGTIVGGLFIGTKVWLALPAQALGRSEYTLGQAWRGSDRNFWRLFAGCILCSAAAWIIPFMPGFDDAGSMQGPFASAARQTLYDVLETFLAGMPVVSFLSLAYRHLIAPGDAVVAQAER